MKSLHGKTCSTAGIIGAGPAGLTAAIQLARTGINAIVFESCRPGGLLHEAHCIENYPGFPGGIPGQRLAALFDEQARKFQVDIRCETVRNVRFDIHAGCFIISADTTVQVRYLIAASGTHPIPSPFPVSPENNRVYRSVIPLRAFRGTHIGIIGGGDAAFDYALTLASGDNTVTILCRNHSPRCLPLLRDRVQNHPRITLRTGCPVSAVPSEFDAVLLAIGREPCDHFLDIDTALQANLQQQNRLHFAGDIRNGQTRQCAIAAGDGLRAAMRIADAHRKSPLDDSEETDQ
ncbi:MAG TPA: NAD(P)/FAD-dependent oxidoreductase [bacterium]|nr:NAD(P)/FAD-dependent oxidoreductase [bacterium]